MSSDPVASRKLSNRTVAIIFGSVILLLTVVFACVGGAWLALTVPLGFLAAATVVILFQITYQRLIFPAVAFLILGVVRLARLFRGQR